MIQGDLIAKMIVFFGGQNERRGYNPYRPRLDLKDVQLERHAEVTPLWSFRTKSRDL